MNDSIARKLDEAKMVLIDEITNLFNKHAIVDTNGNTSIQSGMLSDESLYLECFYEPEWSQELNDEVTRLYELREFWLREKNKVNVGVFGLDSFALNELSIDDLVLCHEYLMLLE